MNRVFLAMSAGRLVTASLVLFLLSACSGIPEDSTIPAPTAEQLEIADEQTQEEAELPTRPFPADSFHDLLVAEFAVRRNRYDLALGNYLQQSHQTKDVGVTARATRLAQYLRADNAALDASQLWVELDPDNIEALYTASTLLAKSQRPMEALEHMTTVLEKGGNTNFAAIAASALQLPTTTQNTVEQRFDQLLVTYPNNAQLLTAKSLLQQQRGEIEPALATIRQVLNTDSDNLHAVVVEARLLQQLDRDEEAFTRLQRVLESHPENRRLRLQYARMLMKDNIPLAKTQFEILLNSEPNDPDLLLSLGLISKETGEIDDANTYFNRLLQTDKRNNEANFYLGQLAEQSATPSAAIDYYKRIIPGTDFLAAINRITNLYVRQDQFDMAREHIQLLRQQYPELAIRLYLLESNLLLNNSDLEGAHNLLSEAMVQSPKQVNFLYARSMLSEKMGNLALMEQDLLEIIAQEPNNATALNALGYVLANRTDRLDQAYQLISRALAAKPNEPAIMDSLGWVEYRRGNLTKALELLSRAHAAFPDHEVSAHLGEVLWKLGRTDQALAIWRQALKDTPDSVILRETLQRLVPATDILTAEPATDNSQ
ncbi:MAG: tetratricopeptide repeat protein [Oceanicoccus sp.]